MRDDKMAIRINGGETINNVIIVTVASCVMMRGARVAHLKVPKDDIDGQGHHLLDFSRRHG